MAKETGISWADSTANLQMGCDGCELWTGKIKNCYAGRLTERYGGRKGWPVSFDKPTIFPERIDTINGWPDLTGQDRPSKPWFNGLPRLIFLNDMGDTFTESLAIDWLLPYIPALSQSPHIFQILTKRPLRALAFFRAHLGYIPPNFWIGVSVTGPENINRIATLRSFSDYFERPPLRFVSYEPTIRPIDWAGGMLAGVDWLIDGGESGPESRKADPVWFRQNRDYCALNGIAYFHKQNGGGRQIGGVWGGAKLDGEIIHQMPTAKAKALLGLLDEGVLNE